MKDKIDVSKCEFCLMQSPDTGNDYEDPRCKRYDYEEYGWGHCGDHDNCNFKKVEKIKALLKNPISCKCPTVESIKEIVETGETNGRKL